MSNERVIVGPQYALDARDIPDQLSFRILSIQKIDQLKRQSGRIDAILVVLVAPREQETIFVAKGDTMNLFQM